MTFTLTVIKGRAKEIDRRDSDPVTESYHLSAIADMLFVSRATVINDLDGVKKFFGRLEVTCNFTFK